MVKLFSSEQDRWYAGGTGVFVILAILISAYAWAAGFRPENIPLPDYFILPLAAFRLARLFTFDKITAFIRDYLRSFPTGWRQMLWDILDCPWCAGMWAALITLYIYFLLPGGIIFLSVLALAGAASYLQIIIWKVGREK